MGLKILPPDINESEIKYTGKDKEIRVGLMQLKDVSQEGLEFIVRERSKHGPFTGLDNFLLRTSGHVHLQDVRVLIKAGCFDSIAQGETRPALLWKALRFFDTPASHSSFDLFEPDAFQTKFLHYPQRTNHKHSRTVTPAKPVPAQAGSGVQKNFKTLDSRLRGNDETAYACDEPGHPSPLRGEGKGGGAENLSSPPYSKSLMLKHELETLGFLLSIHPLDHYKDILKRLDYVRAKDLHTYVGKQVTTIGWLVTGKTVQTKDGDPMKFVSFEDTTGIYETVFFPKVYHRFCHILNEMRPYLLKGKVESDFTAITLTVEWIDFLDKQTQRNRLHGPRNPPTLSILCQVFP
jgi:DNA polymerase III alpha subunit